MYKFTGTFTGTTFSLKSSERSCEQSDFTASRSAGLDRADHHSVERFQRLMKIYPKAFQQLDSKCGRRVSARSGIILLTNPGQFETNTRLIFHERTCGKCRRIPIHPFQ